MTEKKNKTRQLHIRLTEEQEKLIKSKAVNYPTLSGYILDAALHFDDKNGIRKLVVIESWASEYQKWKNDISHLASNINQLAHYCNQCKANGILNNSVVEENNNLMKEWNNISGKIVEFQKWLVRFAKK